ncbi:hypothetical protein G7Y79_00022g051890 [Physcia stellaris]|nr:hypothetical protein G7Y79_00022g051890 [Physcia stellaris]
MARTLPWLKDTSTTSSRATSTRAPKRQRVQEPAPDSDDTSSTAARSAKPPRNASTRPGMSTPLPIPSLSLHITLNITPTCSPLTTISYKDRTPSTSPPPILTPPSTTPMRPGLSADDIYIMVEDEFLSTARLYTQHLHHAEYVRLKRLAATRKTSPSASSINRPVDSITKMREETKRRKEAEKHARKVKDGMEKLVGEAERKLADTQTQAGGSEGEFEEEERMDAPGIGTVLGDLMKTGPRRGGGGLGGLEGVKSSTRAAKGFGRGESGAQGLSKGLGNGVRKAVEVEEDGTTDDDDDLDAPVVRRSKIPATTTQVSESDRDLDKIGIKRPLKPPSASSNYAPRPSSKPLSNGSTNTSFKPSKVGFDAHLSRYKPTSPPKPPINPTKPLKLTTEDDFTRPSNAQTEAIRRRMQARRKKEQGEERKEGEKAFDVDEIPIFLV